MTPGGVDLGPFDLRRVSGRERGWAMKACQSSLRSSRGSKGEGPRRMRTLIPGRRPSRSPLIVPNPASCPIQNASSAQFTEPSTRRFLSPADPGKKRGEGSTYCRRWSAAAFRAPCARMRAGSATSLRGLATRLAGRYTSNAASRTCAPSVSVRWNPTYRALDVFVGKDGPRE